jgi:hypothetical protein
MNLDELKKDLDDKLHSGSYGYFKVKLFKNDTNVFERRSFDDLFKYYKKFKITEKMLLEALYEKGFSAAVCCNINKVVFFRCFKPVNKFWFNVDRYLGYSQTKLTKNTKYTAEYLDNLFKTLDINTKL